MMRKHAVGLAFAVCTVVSLSASAAPDDLQTATTNCNGISEPPSDQVWVYTGPGYSGTCAALIAGFYPNSTGGLGGFGLPNDTISSLKVGSGVRARLFTDALYGGSYFWFGGVGDYATMPSGWNDVASSIRV